MGRDSLPPAYKVACMNIQSQWCELRPSKQIWLSSPGQASVNAYTLSGPHAYTILIQDITGLRKVKTLANSYFQNTLVNLFNFLSPAQ